MNIEKGKRSLMVLAKPAGNEMNGHSTDGPPSPTPKASTPASVEKMTASYSRQKDIGPKLDRGTQSRIGDQLRAMYTDLMEQPVPDKFKALLDQLDQRKEEDRQ